MDVLQSVPPAVTIVLGLLLVAWLVLLLLVPFMIESIRSSTRKAHLELEAISRKLDDLAALLGERGSAPAPKSLRAAEPQLDGPASRTQGSKDTRREPTISG